MIARSIVLLTTDAMLGPIRMFPIDLSQVKT